MNVAKRTLRCGTMAVIVLMTFGTGMAQTADQSPPPAATAVPPPAAPPKRSAADLEKLVAPIALYSDSILATLLPASVYPLEIVQAARFVENTNNLAKLDAQPWDDNVKAIARVPALIQMMNKDISWTIELGEAFLAQDKDVMDTIQNLRGKAQKAGTLRTTEQQSVTVTNVVMEKTIETQVVVVTNTIVQIQSTNPQVVYVPTYNPYTVYYPPPTYVYNPYAPAMTFAVGVAVGAAYANNHCDYYHGGCYNGNVNVDVDRNVNRNSNVNRSGNANTTGARTSSTSGQKWQPDQSRLSKSGSPSAANSARTSEAKGWGSGGAKPSTGTVGAGPSTGGTGTRPSTGSPSGSGSRPSPSASTSASRPSPSSSASRPTASASPSTSRPSSSSSSAFGGTSSGASDRASSSRGASSRSYSGGGGGGRR